eukprot:4179022-Lingulodinium_polyedra.AAC.1
MPCATRTPATTMCKHCQDIGYNCVASGAVCISAGRQNKADVIDVALCRDRKRVHENARTLHENTRSTSLLCKFCSQMICAQLARGRARCATTTA